MRVRVVFVLKNKGAMVPFHHQHLLYQLVEDLLPNYSQVNLSIHNFSGLKGQTQVSQKGLHFFSSKVSWVVSTLDKSFLQNLLASIFSKNEIKIGELLLQPEYIEREVFPELGHQTHFLCISPLVLANPNKNSFYAKHFVSPSIDLFSDLLYEATMSRMEASGLYSEEDMKSFAKFQLIPDKTYLERIKNNDKKFARIYAIPENGSKQEIRGYTLPFTLHAHPKVQNFVVNCGLGSYNHKGYGMLDLADHSQTKRFVLPNWEMAVV
jgi:CRISPR-associated endoribonuclease Cas6